jgi:hypothetical protein
MTTLGEVLFRTARRLAPLYYGQATTGGSATELPDTRRAESADFFNGGTLFFLTGAAAGRSTTVTDFGTGVIYFTGFDVGEAGFVPAQHDAYAVMQKKYNRSFLIAAVNAALADLGPFVETDQALTTVADQEAYTLPAGVSNVLRVEIATSAVAPYDFEAPYRYWREQDGVLYFHESHLPAAADMPVRLHYLENHPWLDDDTDTIHPDVDAELLAVSAALEAARQRVQLAGSSDPEPAQVMQLLAPMAAALRTQRPVRRMARDSRWPGAIPPVERWY